MDKPHPVGIYSVRYPINDDVAFTSDLIDHIAADYAINQSRVYATGWSMGANMSYDIACQLSDRIAAFAPVANQMSEMQIATCISERPTPMLQIHGTSDPIVPYNGAVFPSGMDSFLVATRTAMYWAEQNGCSPTADTTTFADLDTSDQSTVTVYTYGDCDVGADVLFYEITDGGHTWSGGAPLPEFLGPVNRDIHASSEIWNFFNRHPLSDPLVDTRETRSADVHWQVYPNPFRNQVQVGFSLTQKANVTVSLHNLLGQPLWQSNRQQLAAGEHHLAYELEKQLPTGMYVLQLRINETVSSRLVMHNQ